ncbi:general secretion pathway protein GspB [Lysobacter sp. CA196]|uniref:general secretion pathway protein GspB n=1 Tax=Lysobacter sp. CA196 TaxID=3455606 RepID=UPI003F8D126A
MILEALRKSEAERRRGESPDLYAELPPVARVQRRSTPVGWWWVLAAVLVAASAWWLSSRRAPPLTPVADTAAEVADSAGEVSEHDRVVATATPRIDPPALGESPAVEAARVRDPAPVVLPAAPPVTQPIVATTPAPPSAAADSGKSRDKDQNKDRDAKQETVAVAPPPVPAPKPLPVPPPIEVPEPVSPPPVAVASNEGLQLLADLPIAERKQLPPLKLSMHMWNDAPAQRFVIIDGQRLSEGGRIGDAVLVAIRTDGVVLDWNGRRLKLPIR